MCVLEGYRFRQLFGAEPGQMGSVIAGLLVPSRNLTQEIDVEATNSFVVVAVVPGIEAKKLRQCYLKSRFLLYLAHSSFVRKLVNLQESAGNVPASSIGFDSPLDEEQLFISNHQDAGTRLGIPVVDTPTDGTNPSHPIVVGELNWLQKVPTARTETDRSQVFVDCVVSIES